MKLETPEGQCFTLNVERYEFPDEVLGPTEDNPADEYDTSRFIVVSHFFRDKGKEWRASRPTMTTEELEQFANWLQSLLDGSCTRDGIYFTERDLEFSVDKARTKLLVHISGYLLPDWEVRGRIVTIEFPLSCLDLQAAINSIRQQLALFPGLPPLDGTTL